MSESIRAVAPFPDDLSTLRGALQELVALKDLKNRIASLHEGKLTEFQALRAEYARRRPAAWAAASAALSAAPAVPVVWVPYCHTDADNGVRGEYRFDEWDEKPFTVYDPTHWSCVPLYAVRAALATGSES